MSHQAVKTHWTYTPNWLPGLHQASAICHVFVSATKDWRPEATCFQVCRPAINTYFA